MKYVYHSHTTYSDGSLEPKKFIDIAINKNFLNFGISDHSPVPFESDWNMKFENFRKYLKEFSFLKKQFSNKAEIYLGLEADFFENYKYITFWRQFGFDYIIGSVHYLSYELDDLPFNIDKSVENFTIGLDRLFACNVEELVADYYNLVLKMIETDPPDIIGHLTLIEKFNYSNRYFDPTENWYQQKIDEVLLAIKQKNLIIEFNSRAKYLGYTDVFMPSVEIMKKVLKLDIPVIISGDVHSEDDFDKFWDMSVLALKDVGFTEVLFLKDGKWQTFKI